MGQCIDIRVAISRFGNVEMSKSRYSFYGFMVVRNSPLCITKRDEILRCIMRPFYDEDKLEMRASNLSETVGECGKDLS